MNNDVFIIRGNILIVVEKTHDKKNRRKRSNQKYLREKMFCILYWFEIGLVAGVPNRY